MVVGALPIRVIVSVSRGSAVVGVGPDNNLIGKKTFSHLLVLSIKQKEENLIDKTSIRESL